MVEAVKMFRVGALTVKIIVGDITEFQGDAIVNPANSYGYMGGGVALAIKLRGGKVIEEEAVRQAPIPIGSAVITTGGSLKVKAVIHAPTVVRPGDKSSPENVYKATKAALEKAVERGFRSVAFPLMGAGVGGVPPKEAARAMYSAIREYSDKELEVYIYLRDPTLVNAVAEAFTDSSSDRDPHKQNVH